MDTDIALAGLASSMVVTIRAEYTRGVHDAPPGCAWKTLPRGVCLDPRLLYICTAPRFGVELPMLPRPLFYNASEGRCEKIYDLLR